MKRIVRAAARAAGIELGRAADPDRHLAKLYKRYADATMVPEHRFIENLKLARDTLKNTTLSTAAIVECGTWRGGMAAALVEIGGAARDYYFFDSFDGLPTARPIDGAAALAWQANTEDVGYHNNCTASLAEFNEVISRAGPARIKAVKGLFEQTFPTVGAFPIAVLRLDADWYASMTECLAKFWDMVLPGGVILIDDYGVWDGCTKAVHDFLSERKAPEPICRGTIAQTTYIIKRPVAT
jgi:hypothetical protein